MNRMRWIFLLALVLVAAPAFGQGSTTTSLTGTVVDKDGGVVPGATVVAKNNATGELVNTTTNSAGVYSFPSLPAGTYTVTFTLQGFKTAQANNVRLLGGVPGNLGKTTLEIGALNETVEVKGASTEIIRTQSPTVSSTVSTEFVSSLPRSDRNVLSFLIFLPGVQTPGGAQNSRSSTISGLPQNTINISIDGVTTSNLLQTNDGFFTMVTPRPDTVEEVTLSTAAAGADSSGMGATQVKFVTRSGTNQFQQSAYWFFKNKAFNSNTFVNYNISKLPRPQATTNDFGGRSGGPIVIPGLFDGHGKAFYFFNMEEIRTPNERSRARTIARVSAVNGDFTWNNSSPRTVNLYALAAANGVTFNTPDPTIAALLDKIRAAASSTGNIQQSTTAPNTETFNYQIAVAGVRHSPTGKVDVNLSPKHRLSGTYYWERVITDPDTLNNADPNFPGFPAQAGQFGTRTTGNSTLRSTFGSNLVNEVLVGWQSSPANFFGNATPAMFSDPRANQDGFAIGLGFVTNAHPGNSNSPEHRNTINWNIDDNVNWLKGDHSLKFGFEFQRLSNWLEDSTVVRTVNLGLSTGATGDPALNIFNTTNFPTATSTDLNNARSLYGMLTGRITSLPGTGQLNNEGTEYIYNGVSRDSERQDTYALYASDSWRWKPNVTYTLGVRYNVQMPMVATLGRLVGSQMNDVCGISGQGNGVGGRQCNLFQPGFFGNPSFTNSTFVPLSSETKGYNLDTNNFGPSVGVNWRPMVQSGIGRKLLGDPEQATVSGGYTRTFNFERFDRFLEVYVGNPGSNVPATRGYSSTQFAMNADGLGNPVVFSQKDRLGVPNFTKTPSFPLTATTSQGIFVFDPNIRTPNTDSWTMGLQRSISRDMAIEARYIGNRNNDPWVDENWNTTNWRESGLVGSNGFDGVANQFALAQANLRANIAAGNGATFAYTGAPGTSPLPLFLAAFTSGGQSPSNAGNTALYTSTQFTNTTWIDDLDPFFPSPQNIAGNLRTATLSGVPLMNNILASGYPVNLFQLNPTVNSANVTRNLGGSNYNALQIDLRRRFSKGLQASGSYTYARGNSQSNLDLHLPLVDRRQTLNPHQFTMLWTWDTPVGRGKRFGTNMNPWMNGVLGGWVFSGSGRVYAPIFRLTDTTLVGMTKEEAGKLFKQIRIDTTTGAIRIWSMPKDVVDNTILAYSTDARQPDFYLQGTPTGRFFAPASHPGSSTAGLSPAGSAALASVYGQNDPGCVRLLAQDCAPDMFFTGKWFGEFDIKLAKKFFLPGKAIFQMDIDVFNVFKATNFGQTFNPGSGSTIFSTQSQNSAARTGQLSWRISW